jgi:ATP-dependent RNA helicase DDX31/DBP7
VPKKQYKPYIPKPLTEEEKIEDAKPLAPLDQKLEVLESDVFAGEKFDDLPVNAKLKQILKENNFDELTNIQKSAVPVILQNQNVMLKSETGSGKTLAYLVPLLEYLSHRSLTKEKITREHGTYCIIFSPTRELCV